MDYTHTHTHTHTRARTHTHTRTHTRTHTHAHTRTRTHAHTRTHMRAHTHTHTHTRAHTHSHARAVYKRRWHSDPVTCILTSMCLWHMGSRWYTSDLYVITMPVCRTVVQWCESRHRRNLYQRVSSCEVTACFTSASFANRLPARCCLRVSRRW
jgi:hypothetical protein